MNNLEELKKLLINYAQLPPEKLREIAKDSLFDIFLKTYYIDIGKIERHSLDFKLPNKIKEISVPEFNIVSNKNYSREEIDKFIASKQYDEDKVIYLLNHLKKKFANFPIFLNIFNTIGNNTLGNNTIKRGGEFLIKVRDGCTRALTFFTIIVGGFLVANITNIVDPHNPRKKDKQDQFGSSIADLDYVWHSVANLFLYALLITLPCSIITYLLTEPTKFFTDIFDKIKDILGPRFFRIPFFGGEYSHSSRKSLENRDLYTQDQISRVVPGGGHLDCKKIIRVFLIICIIFLLVILFIQIQANCQCGVSSNKGIGVFSNKGIGFSLS